MDKYEIEQFEHIKELAADLQACFIDDDAYSRTPSSYEWRRAGRLVRQITLSCFELTGYANAKRHIELDFVKQNLRVVKNETPPGENPTAKITPIRTLEDINAMLVELNIKLKARQRADGLFEIRPSIGGVRKSFYGKTAEELAKKYNDYLNEKPRKKDRAKSTTYLFDWFNEWLEVYKQPNIRKNSYMNIVRCVEKQLKPALQNKTLSKYSLTELMRILNKIESTRMRKYARGILMDCFRCAVVAGKITSSQAQNLPPVKHIVQKGKAISLVELKKMIEDSAQILPKNVFHYYLFCLFSGTRREEGLSIKKDDFDFSNEIIYIHGTKTEGSERRIPMFPILKKIISNSSTQGTENIFNIGLYTANANFKLFRGKNSKAVLHWLRHTFGTIQICIEKVPVNTVALWLGHSDASTTMKIYTHPEDLAPDIYFSGKYSEEEKNAILKERYNSIISTVEKLI